ncbi:MAG: hypothetical protein ABSH39_19665 [Candidatus Acidiferrum sp.]|jgi:hypothetical protein
MAEFDDALNCPECGTWGAKKSWFKVKCVNRNCPKYDAERAASLQKSRIVGKSAIEIFPHLKGTALADDYNLQIRYRNFRGDELVYSADPETGYQQGQHAVFRLAPTGKPVTFNLQRIQNRGEVEAVLAKSQQPSGSERKLLRRHLRAGTTSKRFEELRAKYPKYRD